jgi:hypothetical protein
VVCLFVSIGALAGRYGRNVAMYVILSFFAKPIVMLILLFCLGEEEHHKAERFADEWKFIKKILNESEQLKVTMNELKVTTNEKMRRIDWKDLQDGQEFWVTKKGSIMRCRSEKKYKIWNNSQYIEADAAVVQPRDLTDKQTLYHDAWIYEGQEIDD